ncbi:MAG: hypothetical protein ACXADX_07055 [Candidatus Hodarchaeales archaeon]
MASRQARQPESRKRFRETPQRVKDRCPVKEGRRAGYSGGKGLYLKILRNVGSTALQMIFSGIDVLILPAAIIGSIMNILILVMILFPEKIPFNFDEPQFPDQLPGSPEDD